MMGTWSPDPAYLLVSDLCEVNCFSCVRLCATPRTVARQAPLFVGLSKQESWSGLPFPTPGNIPPGNIPGIEPMSLASPALAGEFFTTSATWEAPSDL